MVSSLKRLLYNLFDIGFKLSIFSHKNSFSLYFIQCHLNEIIQILELSLLMQKYHSSSNHDNLLLNPSKVSGKIKLFSPETVFISHKKPCSK